MAALAPGTDPAAPIPITPPQLFPETDPEAVARAAADVAHDLNSTLQAIGHQAELLRCTCRREDETRRLDLILQAVATGGQLVRRLRVAGGADCAPAAVDLRGLLEDVAEITRFRWGRVAGDPRPPLTVQLDLQDVPPVPGQVGELQQVFTNLVINACEAMPQGGAIWLRTRHDGQHAVAMVSDDGPGMTEETRTRVFNRAFSTKGADNSGLGLSIVADIVARHGGHVIVESAPDQGTTFYVMLHPAAAAGAAATGAAELPPCQVLVADDDPAVRTSLQQILSAAGHEVTTAASGREALQRLPAGCDVLLTDYGLGDLTGLQLALAARRRQPGLKVVLLTGWEDCDHGARDHVDLVLHKPLGGEQLLTAVTKARQM